VVLGRSPFDFPILMKEEKEAMIRGKTCLKVVRTPERILTISSDISTMSDESFHPYLVLTGQMDFNIKSFLVIFSVWFDLVITTFNSYPWETFMICTHF
jgi:hypothetical protein